MRGVRIDGPGLGQAEHVQTRIPGDDARRIAALVVRRRRSRAAVTRELIRLALDTIEREPEPPG